MIVSITVTWVTIIRFFIETSTGQIIGNIFCHLMAAFENTPSLEMVNKSPFGAAQKSNANFNMVTRHPPEEIGYRGNIFTSISKELLINIMYILAVNRLLQLLP